MTRDDNDKMKDTIWKIEQIDRIINWLDLDPESDLERDEAIEILLEIKQGLSK